VLNVIDFITNAFIMADRTKSEMDALNRALMSKLMEPSAAVSFVVLDFVFGILLVFTYAAIRPRFGAGAGTAAKARPMEWAVSAATWCYTEAMGLFSTGYFVWSAVMSLVTMVAGAYVGASLYRED